MGLFMCDMFPNYWLNRKQLYYVRYIHYLLYIVTNTLFLFQKKRNLLIYSMAFAD